jgi:putative chitinase
MWFWQEHGLNELAVLDNGQNTDDICKKITKKINGGYNGLAQRLYFLRKFKKEFAV